MSKEYDSFEEIIRDIRYKANSLELSLERFGKLESENRHLKHKISKLQKENSELNFIKTQLEDEIENIEYELANGGMR